MKNQSCCNNVKDCIAACEECIIECKSKGNTECMKLCMDCADICTLCMKLNERDSKYFKDCCELCTKVCTDCAAICEKNGYAECAAICKKCAESCHNS